MLSRIASMVLFIALLMQLSPWSPVARAADPSVGTSPGTERGDDPRALAEEGLALLMQALRLLVRSVPQYELPVINENGDIIIRRRRPSAPDAPAPRSPPEGQPTQPEGEPANKGAVTL